MKLSSGSMILLSYLETNVLNEIFEGELLVVF